MFDNLKKIAELKKMQDSFKKERESVEISGVFVSVNGNLDIEEVRLNPDLDVKDQQNIVKQCFNEAKDNIQKRLAKSLMGSGFGF
jgi:DNA-binding protein YbaB